MEYFTERHNLRKTMDFSGEITKKEYSVLVNVLEDYEINIAWMFPELDFSTHCTGISYYNFRKKVRLDIPDLVFDQFSGLGTPHKLTEISTFALLDYIEFVAKHYRDVKIYRNTGKTSYTLLGTNKSFSHFKQEINNTFHRLGLLYILSDENRVERVPVNTPLSSELVESIVVITEKGLKDLLQESVELFKSPKPENQKLAVEKIWDALERLKSYYTDLDKKHSAIKLVDKMSNSEENFKNLFNDEFSTLTKIGNNFRIRHHETDKIDITDPRHFDYFFNRCLSLIALAIPYLEE